MHQNKKQHIPSHFVEPDRIWVNHESGSNCVIYSKRDAEKPWLNSQKPATR